MEEGLSKVITTADATRNDYNLSPSRWVGQTDLVEQRPIKDIVAELRWASILAKVTDGNYQAGLHRDVFNAATLAACRFLRRNDLGRLAPGAKADILLINLDHLGAPIYADPIKALVQFFAPFSGLASSTPALQDKI